MLIVSWNLLIYSTGMSSFTMLWTWFLFTANQISSGARGEEPVLGAYQWRRQEGSHAMVNQWCCHLSEDKCVTTGNGVCGYGLSWAERTLLLLIIRKTLISRWLYGLGHSSYYSLFLINQEYSIFITVYLPPPPPPVHTNLRSRKSSVSLEILALCITAALHILCGHSHLYTTGYSYQYKLWVTKRRLCVYHM